MNHAQREGVEIDQCSTCGGTWLDAGELRDVVDRHDIDHGDEARARANAEPRAIAAGDQRPALSCPVCKNTLERYPYDEASGVLIDSCMTHGVWLDHGELERAEAWIEAHSDTYDAPSSDPEAAARLQASNEAFAKHQEAQKDRGPFRRLASDTGFWWSSRKQWQADAQR